MFRMPGIISIKKGRGHPKNVTNLYTMKIPNLSKIFMSSYCIGDIEF